MSILESRLRELEGSPASSQNSSLPLQQFPSPPAEHGHAFYDSAGISEGMYGGTFQFSFFGGKGVWAVLCTPCFYSGKS